MLDLPNLEVCFFCWHVLYITIYIYQPMFHNKLRHFLLTHCLRAGLLIKYPLWPDVLNAFNVHSHNILQAYCSKIRFKSGLSVCNLRSKHPACSWRWPWTDQCVRPARKRACWTSCKKTQKCRACQQCMGEQSRISAWADGNVLTGTGSETGP